MRYVEDVSGSFVSGSVEKLLVSVICAYVVFTLMTYIDLKPILEALIPLKAPFKNISVLGGFLIVFWVSLAYRSCGKGYGIATALLAVSFCLFVSPWYDVIKPYWFSVAGFLSFLLLGVLTEYVNGGVGNLACILVNWSAAVIAGFIKVNLLAFAVLGFVAFISGYAGDLAAKKVIELIFKS